MTDAAREIVVDMFAGAGGASCGIRAAIGRDPDVAINHNPLAIEIHALNHPDTEHLTCDVFEVEPLAATRGRQVGLLWASPDCTHFSRAKGGRPVERRIRSLAWVVVRWAAKVRPRVILLENVPEFKTWGPLGPDNRPLKHRKGETFRRWSDQLRGLGYEVEFRELVAADYGTPTTRKRLFMVARCDGEPIRWPERTHAPRHEAKALGKRPWRAAAECIDWSRPCPSIFERKRPLAEATLRRIAKGLQKFVFCPEADGPFMVVCNHSGAEFRGQSPADPMPTLCASRDAHGLVVPTMVQVGYGERTGQAPRTLDIGNPLGTVVGGGSKHALVQAFLNRFYGKSTGQTLDDPMPTESNRGHSAVVEAWLLKNNAGSHSAAPAGPLHTVTTGARHYACAAYLTKLYGTCRHGQDAREPMPAVTAGGYHVAEVRAFLIKYFGSGGQWGDCRDPLATVTAKHRLGLVTIHGGQWQIVDIGLRMLEWDELLAAQFGRFAKGYKLLGTKSRRVAAIGNSVPPEVAELLVRANYAEAAVEAATAGA